MLCCKKQGKGVKATDAGCTAPLEHMPRTVSNTEPQQDSRNSEQCLSEMATALESCLLGPINPSLVMPCYCSTMQPLSPNA